MSQSDTTASTRFSLLPGSITRFFLLLIVVLLVMMGVMVQSAVNTWLKDKSYQIVDITHAIHKRVDTWRYVTGKSMTILPLRPVHWCRRTAGNASETRRLLSWETAQKDRGADFRFPWQFYAGDDPTHLNLSWYAVGRGKCSVVYVLPEWSGQ